MAAARACIRGLSVPQLLCPPHFCTPRLIRGPRVIAPVISSRELARNLRPFPGKPRPSIPGARGACFSHFLEAFLSGGAWRGLYINRGGRRAGALKERFPECGGVYVCVCVLKLCCRDYGRFSTQNTGPQKLRYASPGSIHHSNLTRCERLARRDTA